MFRALALRRSRLCGILPLLTVEVNLLRCVHTSDVNANARAVKTSVNATWRRRKEKENFPFLAHTLRLHSLLLQKFPSVNGGDANTDASLPPPPPPQKTEINAHGHRLCLHHLRCCWNVLAPASTLAFAFAFAFTCTKTNCYLHYLIHRRLHKWLLLKTIIVTLNYVFQCVSVKKRCLETKLYPNLTSSICATLCLRQKKIATFLY